LTGNQRYVFILTLGEGDSMRKTIAALTIGAALGASSNATAYPSAVVFAPSGDAKGLGTVGTFLYTALLYRPRTAPGVTWVGTNVGVAPAFAYGSSGVGFGGFEIGVDAINAFVYPGEFAYVKPVFNAKLQLVTENDWFPNVAVGAMEIAPTRHSQDVGYLSMTKTLKSAERSYGRVTLGLGVSFTGDTNLFRPTPPFDGTRLFPIAGYESPALGPLSLAVDHVGGVSEVSGTNVALNLTPTDGVTWSVGAFFGNDRGLEETTYDGLFTYLAVSTQVATWFKSRRETPPAAP
jgi:hypothetical protein